MTRGPAGKSLVALMQLDSLNVTELTMLGIVLETGGRALDEIELTPEQFTSPQHGRIFEAMTKIHSLGRSVDLAGLMQQLSQDDGILVIGQVTEIRGYAELAEHHAERIAAAALRRDLAAVGQGLIDLDPNLTPDQMLEYARKHVDQAEGVRRARLQSMPELWASAIDGVTETAVYSPTPWPSLNDAIGGLKAGALHVFAARPGIGKTIVAMQMAAKLGETGVVAFSSLEMTKEELTLRGIAAQAGVNISALSRGKLDARGWEAVAKKRPEFISEVYIDDRGDVGPAQIRKHARAVARKGNLTGIFVDYIQLMTGPGSERREEKVADFSRQLKLMAKEFMVPVVALSQLNRNAEHRPDKKPGLADLRESGAIEQDADMVVLLSREEETATFYMDVAKNRAGRTALVELVFRGEHSRIDDYRGNI